VSNTNFNQAEALIGRLMERVGGSSDAYEEPLSAPGVVEEEPAPTLAKTSEAPEDDITGEVCTDGTVDWEAFGDQVWTNPPPVSDDYQPRGVVEDSEELLALYKGFQKALETGNPQIVTIESGMYQIEKSAPGVWQLKDLVKDRLYIQEDVSGHYDVVDPTDLFFWVVLASDADVDLGYVHMGYIFLRK
jgi:hypothetical protein